MTLFCQRNRVEPDSPRRAFPMTSDYSVLQPITADDASITFDCSRLHFIASDNSKLHSGCNSPLFALI